MLGYALGLLLSSALDLPSGALIVWCLATILKNGYQPVPLPVPANLKFNPDALGWLKGTLAPSITAIAILIGLGHSLRNLFNFGRY